MNNNQQTNKKTQHVPATQVTNVPTTSPDTFLDIKCGEHDKQLFKYNVFSNRPRTVNITWVVTWIVR